MRHGVGGPHQQVGALHPRSRLRVGNPWPQLVRALVVIGRIRGPRRSARHTSPRARKRRRHWAGPPLRPNGGRAAPSGGGPERSTAPARSRSLPRLLRADVGAPPEAAPHTVPRAPAHGGTGTDPRQPRGSDERSPRAACCRPQARIDQPSEPTHARRCFRPARPPRAMRPAPARPAESLRPGSPRGAWPATIRHERPRRTAPRHRTDCPRIGASRSSTITHPTEQIQRHRSRRTVSSLRVIPVSCSRSTVGLRPSSTSRGRNGCRRWRSSAR